MPTSNATDQHFTADTATTYNQAGAASVFAPPVFVPHVRVPKPAIDLVPRKSQPDTPRCRIWDVDFDRITMDQTVAWIDAAIENRLNTYAITANLNYLMLCSRYPRLADFTRRCPLVLCDGKPIQWRSQLEGHSLPERVAGSDLIYRLAESSAAKGHRIYLLGGADGVAEKAAAKLEQLYPGVQICGIDCPPFGQWSFSQRMQINNKIVDTRPDILLVAFGQPKGEFWIQENYEDLQVPVSIQVGASFDFVAGNSRRAPKLMQSIGLEWLYRTAKDPRRLGPRYISNAWYLLKTIRRELLTKLEPSL